MTPPPLDFDRGRDWIPDLARSLASSMPDEVGSRLTAAAPEGPWGALEMLLAQSDIDRLVETTRRWITARDVILYHGTRVNDAQQAAILREGLRPLDPDTRDKAIEAFLSDHPRWSEVEPRLAEAIASVIAQGGTRQGQVHAMLSRSGLVRGCNHYLVEGSEFDHHVANYLLGEVCHRENQRRGSALLVRFHVDGSAAIAAANPFGEIGATPNLIRELLSALAWWLATGDYDTEAFEEGCAVIFYQAIPPEQIIQVLPVADSELWPHYDNRLR